jgi:amino acid transporter
LLSALLAGRGYSGLDIYAWTGSLAVYGFLTAYGLVAAALPFYLRRKRHLTPAATTLAAAATVAMLLGMIGTLYPVPIDRPYTWLPYAYLAYLAVTLGWFWLSQRIGRTLISQ